MTLFFYPTNYHDNAHTASAQPRQLSRIAFFGKTDKIFGYFMYICRILTAGQKNEKKNDDSIIPFYLA